MPLVNVDTTQEDLFEQPSFEPVPKGVYICSLGNLPGTPGVKPEKELRPQTSRSGNPNIPVCLVVEGDAEGSETPYKGRMIFDNCALSHEVGIKKLAHLALAFGAMTQGEIRDAGGVDTDRFTSDMRGKVDVGTKSEIYEGEDRVKNVARRYLFES